MKVSSVLVVFTMVVVGNHAMKISKQTTLTMEEDDDKIDLGSLEHFLGIARQEMNVELTKHDVLLEKSNDENTELDVFDPTSLKKVCTKGSCKLCGKVLKAEVCLVAAVLKQGFSVEVDVNGKAVFKKEINVQSPPPICVSEIPGIKQIENLCLKLDKVDLQQLSACAAISCKVNLGPVHKNVKIDVGCFKIPSFTDGTVIADVMDEQPDTVDASIITMSQESLKLLAENQGQTIDQISMADDDMVALMEELFAATADEFDIELNGTLKQCSGNKCSFCTPGHYLNLCVIGAYLPDRIGFSLSVTVNGKEIYHTEISVANPPPICFNHIPVVKHVTNICVELYNIDLKTKSACVKLSFKILIKKINLKLGCFKIPIAAGEMVALSEV